MDDNRLPKQILNYKPVIIIITITIIIIIIIIIINGYVNGEWRRLQNEELHSFYLRVP